MPRRVPCATAAFLISLAASAGALAEATRNIMITGYWPPTNEMIRRFSTNEVQNPDGWIGGNWEGRGYGIYSFFPEFDEESWPIGEGDFEVDYQDTSEDWWRIVEDVDPVAIITFSRGNDDRSWEVEYQQRNLKNWVPDYRDPKQPTPTPPDQEQKVGFKRYSSLPMDEIVQDVNDANLGLRAYVDRRGYGGGFLSEFIAYHGVWYHDLHADKYGEVWNIAAGHIHVGAQVEVEIGIQATEISLRSLIEYVDSIIPEPSAGLLLLAGTIFLRRR